MVKSNRDGNGFSPCPLFVVALIVLFALFEHTQTLFALYCNSLPCGRCIQEDASGDMCSFRHTFPVYTWKTMFCEVLLSFTFGRVQQLFYCYFCLFLREGGREGRGGRGGQGVVPKLFLFFFPAGWSECCLSVLPVCLPFVSLDLPSGEGGGLLLSLVSRRFFLSLIMLDTTNLSPGTLTFGDPLITGSLLFLPSFSLDCRSNWVRFFTQWITSREMLLSSRGVTLGFGFSNRVRDRQGDQLFELIIFLELYEI